MNYEKMSDGEITWRVHHAVNEIPDGYATICTEDYCNNPSDAWPIITENHISIELDEGCLAEAYILESYASGNKADRISCIDQNPLRAACICFLKMKDAEK